MKSVYMVLFVGVLMVAGCLPWGDKDADQPVVYRDGVKRIAFITDGASDFWERIHKGCIKAERKYDDVEIIFKNPQAGDVLDQRRIFQDMLARRMPAVAICPVNTRQSKKWLRQGAGQTLLVTIGGDVPGSRRKFYIGADNYRAGMLAGYEIRKAIESKGDVLFFGASMDNAVVESRYAGIERVLRKTEIRLLDLRTDQHDRLRAIANVEDAIIKNPDVNCLVGLSSYSGPAIYRALNRMGRTGEFEVICFDGEPATLKAIKENVVRATIVQRPFLVGFRAVQNIAAVLDGDESAIPSSSAFTFSAYKVTKEDVWDYEIYWH